jgi:hypothetical protein
MAICFIFSMPEMKILLNEMRRAFEACIVPIQLLWALESRWHGNFHAHLADPPSIGSTIHQRHSRYFTVSQSTFKMNFLRGETSVFHSEPNDRQNAAGSEIQHRQSVYYAPEQPCRVSLVQSRKRSLFENRCSCRPVRGYRGSWLDLLTKYSVELNGFTELEEIPGKLGDIRGVSDLMSSPHPVFLCEIRMALRNFDPN